MRVVPLWSNTDSLPLRHDGHDVRIIPSQKMKENTRREYGERQFRLAFFVEMYQK